MTIRGLPRRFAGEIGSTIIETIEDLLIDKRIKFNMLAGQTPVLDRVKEKLTKAKMRFIEEYGRFKNDYKFKLILIVFRWAVIYQNSD